MDVKWFPRFNCLVVELHFPILGNWKFGAIPIYTSVSWKCRTCFFLRRMSSWPPYFCLGVVDVFFGYVFLGGGKMMKLFKGGGICFPRNSQEEEP